MAKNNSTIDRIQAVWNKLGGEEGIDRLLAGEWRLTSNFPVWKRVRLGLFQNADQYRRAIAEERGLLLSKCADTLLGKIFLSKEEVDLELVIVTPKQLGFTERPSLDDLYARAYNLGLERCPHEVGFAFLLQADLEWHGIDLGVETFVNEFGETCTLAISMSSAFCLTHNAVSFEKTYPLDWACVFVKPRK